MKLLPLLFVLASCTKAQAALPTYINCMRIQTAGLPQAMGGMWACNSGQAECLLTAAGAISCNWK